MKWTMTSGFAVAAIHCAAFTFASDVDGTWTAEFETQMGVQRYLYEFHADGNVLTGTATSDFGTVEISDGTIQDNEIRFVENTFFQDEPLRITYSGTVDGDEIKFARNLANFATEEFIAERVKE